MQSLKLVVNPDEIHADSLADLFGSVGFGETNVLLQEKDYVRRTFPQGVYGYFLISDDGSLVAVARVLSDNYSVSWLSEIIVKPSWQRKGVGRTLLSLVLNRFSHTAFYCFCFPGQEYFFCGEGLVPKEKLKVVSRKSNNKQKPN